MRESTTDNESLTRMNRARKLLDGCQRALDAIEEMQDVLNTHYGLRPSLVSPGGKINEARQMLRRASRDIEFDLSQQEGTIIRDSKATGA